MFDYKGRFIIEDYATKSAFASFLPGISGKMGIPIWSFYVNRGQAICSFGVEDKNHSIMEFYPAHQAYQNTSTLGFRTFLKVDGTYYEPFYEEEIKKNMYIGMNELEIEEINLVLGIQINILYYTLPNEALGGLVRKVTIKNLSNKSRALEILDGMPAILPYGVDLNAMKTMGQTTKAWMQVEDVTMQRPYYRVRVGMEDSAVVQKVEGGHFCYTISQEGSSLPVIVDPEVIFKYNSAMTRPIGFMTQDIEALLAQKQVCQNNVPCSFFGTKTSIDKEETFSLYSVIGQVKDKELLKVFIEKIKDKAYFEGKYTEAVGLTEKLCEVIETKTASKTFDAYCKQTYLDNVLRGGYPIVLGEKSIYHVYSRKHGDIERDYNFFCMRPEHYSQGNANFRDVNQNRRCDSYFTPYVKDYNIKSFYNLIQLDGYNPLAVQGVSYTLDKKYLQELLREVKGYKEGNDTALFLETSFTPGSLIKYITNHKIELHSTLEVFINKAISLSEGRLEANFGEGYWTDHWTYNLDLIETFLDIYPEEESRLLFQDNAYTYFESRAHVRPRRERYRMTERGIRQYNAIDHVIKEKVKHTEARINQGKGEIYTSSLFEKLVILATNKFATLDPYGMGIEMEGGKPGWYDALNGLPGIFGSSMAETYEVYRLIEFMIAKLEMHGYSMMLPKEVITFMNKINKALESFNKGGKDALAYWDEVNTAKEEYREAILWGIDGQLEEMSAKLLLELLKRWLIKLNQGILKALSYGEGICPTYFTYEMIAYEVRQKGVIEPQIFKVQSMPYFLEGSVRFFKINHFKQERKVMYEKIRKSKLYDTKLQMYKVNISLEEASFEIGRAKAFTPGWLENESIWLHMEYKYLLEMLKSELYEEFFEDLKTACVPFLDASVYGRSLLENSSFIASSANPNESIQGKGFVARLSGSTAEFIHMWHLMMIGKQPFTLKDDVLCLEFKPVIPKYLIDETKEIQCKFLGTIQLNYHLTAESALIPGKYQVQEVILTYIEGKQMIIEGSIIEGRAAQDVRARKVQQIDIKLDTLYKK